MKSSFALITACAVMMTMLSVVTAPTARAAGVTALPTSNFSIESNYHLNDPVVDALVSKLGTAKVSEVMDSANHDRKPLGSLPLAHTGFRFDDSDNSTCAAYPQGITTSRDAVGTANNGRYDGRQVVGVSWYTKDACDGKTTRSRLTLTDWDANYPNKYRKILFVAPTGTAAAPNFVDIPIHAGGVSWYGHYLYLADTGKGMRIFDMRKIVKVDVGGSAADIGLSSDGKYHAHNYRYVLPQIGEVTSAVASGTVKLNWSTISLDRVSKSMVMTEYTCNGCTKYPDRAPRAVRFPFGDGGVFPASTKASQALQLPFYNLNGVASHNNRWWFASSAAKELYYWTPTAGAHTYPWVSYAESISYWEDATEADLLWSLREGAGNRDVFTVKQASYDG
ncbi:hypothetical protein ACQBAR_08765 [Propionibacteriaceae bacterium Y1685]